MGKIAHQATSANAFTNPRTIKLTGEVTGEISSTGLNGWTIPATVSRGIFLPLDGSEAMTGALSLVADAKADTLDGGALNAQGSNINKVNALFFNACDSKSPSKQGIQFARSDNNNMDVVYAEKGALYFAPNRVLGGTSSGHKILTSNNYSDYAVTKTGSNATGTGWAIGITGNAATATALTSNAGDAMHPIYFTSGKPKQCNDVLANSIAGNAATATKLKTAVKINGTDFDGTEDITTTNWGPQTTFKISDGTNSGIETVSSGGGTVTITLPTTIKATLSGTADKAKALSVSAAIGSASKPVYIDANGVPQECTSIALKANTAGTADKAKALTSDIQLTICGSVKNVNVSKNGSWTAKELTGYDTADALVPAVGGKIPSTYLPSYVDDVIEGYYLEEKFYTTNSTSGTQMTGMAGIIYVDLNTNNTYRYGTTSKKYIQISNPIEIGTTTGTAMDGGIGTTHINNHNNPHQVSASQINALSTIATTAQNVASAVTFKGKITASGGIEGNLTGNVTGSVTGNADTATKLKTARTINGTSFDGSKNITTSSWGTSRQITIGLKVQGVDGSKNLTWSLGDIGAVPAAGGTMTGDLTMSMVNENRFINFTHDGNETGYDWRIGHLGEGAGDQNYFVIQSNSTTGTWTNAIRIGLTTLDTIFGGDVSPVATNTYTLGTSDLKWKNIYATTFTGALSGNASTATKLKTARSLQVDLTSDAAQTFNGSADATSIGVKGTLDVANGGTGNNTAYIQNALVYASETTKLASASTVKYATGQLTIEMSDGSEAKYVTKNSNGSVSLWSSTNRGVYDETRKGWLIYNSQNSEHTYVPLWSSIGTSTRPIYFTSNGEPAACGALVNLNGVDLTGSKASFYAPTGAGTSGYFLASNGSGAPSWVNSTTVGMTFGGVTINGNGAGSGTDSIDFGQGLKIRRSTGDTEALKITVDDSVARFFYTNDERSSSFRFVMHNADTESPVVANTPVPSTSVVTFTGDANGSHVTASYFSGNGASLTNLNADNIKSGTLPVSRGGTGIASMTSNAVLLGGSTVGQVAAASGAFYSTGANVKPVFGTLPVAQGGTGITSNPSMLVNLGSTSADTVFKASPRPGVTGTLGTANGGTGRNSGWVGNRMVYSETASKLSSTGHYASSTQIAINSGSAPASGVALHVEGNANIDGALSLDSAAKFVYNSTDKCIDVIFM